MKDEYKTSDLALATTLLCYGLPCIGIETNAEDPKRKLFVFKSNNEVQPAIDDLVDKFWKKECRIEPLEYSMNMRELKNRLHGM